MGQSGTESSAAGRRIGGERRSCPRYGIALEVRWHLLHRRKVMDSGIGRTMDLSSGGILFQTDRELPVGRKLYLSVAWPVLLHDSARLQLTMEGRIVRSEGDRVAVKMALREFRTAGAARLNQGAACRLVVGQICDLNCFPNWSWTQPTSRRFGRLFGPS